MLISIVVLGWLYTSLHTAVHCPPTSDTNQYHTHAICSEFFFSVTASPIEITTTVQS